MRPVPQASVAGVRLAICSDTYLPQVNGVARTLSRLAETLRDRGGDVRIFTSADAGACADASVRRYASLPFWAYPQLRLAAPSSLELERELREWGATLVHAATPFGVGLAGRAAARRANIPFVTSYHTSFTTYARFYRLGALAGAGWRFLRWFHNAGARTYCPTQAIASELHDHGFERVAVWGRGVDSARFNPGFRSSSVRLSLGADDNTAIVAYVGRIALEKGLDTAIDGMRRAIAMSRRPIRFVLVGDGPWADECRRRLSPGMTMLGELHGESLSALYASADAFVFPSTTDTFGNVLIEAMASGLPIVGADSPPTRELLGGSIAGTLFTPGSSAALADAVCDLVADPDAAATRGHAALEVARRRQWSTVFDDLFADYTRVIGAPARVRDATPGVARAVPGNGGPSRRC